MERNKQPYIVLQLLGSSSSLSSRGITFSPTMSTITPSRGPPPFLALILFFLLLGTETTASNAERCFRILLLYGTLMAMSWEVGWLGIMAEDGLVGAVLGR